MNLTIEEIYKLSALGYEFVIEDGEITYVFHR